MQSHNILKMMFDLAFLTMALALVAQAAPRSICETALHRNCDPAEAPSPPKPNSTLSWLDDSQAARQQPLDFVLDTPDINVMLATQTLAPWALARLAQSPTLTGMDTATPTPTRAKSSDWSFEYDETWGAGVAVYIVDSGVAKHDELGNRLEAGRVIPSYDDGRGANVDVCNHGTGVASLVAGKTAGIARSATIVPIRIAEEKTCGVGSTTNADVVAGVGLAIEDFKVRKPTTGVINISWSTVHTDTLAKALEEAIGIGMHVVLSAGNDGADLGPSGPDKQRVKDVGQLVVGGVDWTDTRRMTSNYGDCITLWAPGASLTFASNAGPDAFRIDSGSSFAAPLVAGVVSALADGHKTPAQMRDLIVSSHTAAVGLKDIRGSPDRLLQSLIPSPKLQ
ncbi:peptidase S8/S53 domain-containing protein [Mycena belliarum]|uniref:Peptidase S8/S53 domain-containing protein n=1 Tax=Mycena belliarum TaxID=1033014 RepID=A0AAD6XQQ3_9AGAR|nr:peptidase S8/S53 domain-containing protein [Mycena belliae]